MVKIMIPNYLIGNEDKVDQFEAGNAIINVQSGESVTNTLLNLRNDLPGAISKIMENDKIKKNTIIAYNENLLNQKSFDKLTTKDNDEIEVLTQFAGG